MVLLPLVSIPELETWIETWSFSETIHSRSYTHIIRNVVNDPSKIFEDIVDNEYILERASDIAKYYDDLHLCAKLYDLHGEGVYQIDGQSVEVTLPKLKNSCICVLSLSMCLKPFAFMYHLPVRLHSLSVK